MNIFKHHANADPFSEESPFYQFKDKNALINEMYNLTSLIADNLTQKSSLLFDYLHIIATFGGQSILKDSTHVNYQDYVYFLNEIVAYENKKSLDFLALCLKMGILLTPKHMGFSTFDPPFDEVLHTIKNEFHRSGSSYIELTGFLIEKTKTEGSMVQRFFSSIHGMAKCFQDVIPLPFMGDLNAGDIVRATPNGINKLWLSGIPVNPIANIIITNQLSLNGIFTNQFLLNGITVNYIKCYADGVELFADNFLFHDWFHLSNFLSSLYVDKKTLADLAQISCVTGVQFTFSSDAHLSFAPEDHSDGLENKMKNLLMIKKIQEWMDMEDPHIVVQLKEFIAFYLTHESVVLDPFYDIFQNHWRYNQLKKSYYHLIHPHYYAPLLPQEIITNLKTFPQVLPRDFTKEEYFYKKIHDIFDPVYRSLRIFASPYFSLKKNYRSPFMKSARNAYNKGVFSFLTPSSIIFRGPLNEEFLTLYEEMFSSFLNPTTIKECTSEVNHLISQNTATYREIGIFSCAGISFEDGDLVKKALAHHNYDVAAELILRGDPYTAEQFHTVEENSTFFALYTSATLEKITNIDIYSNSQ